MLDLEEAVEAIDDGEFGEGSAALGHRRKTERSGTIRKRWDYFHARYHGAGFLLNPAQHSVNHKTNGDIMEEVRDVIGRVYHDDPGRAARASM